MVISNSTLAIALIFVVHVAAQFAAVAMLPTTRGFTAPLPTVAVSVIFLIAIAAAARVVESGVNLSLIIPISTVVLQLMVLAVAIFVYKEPTSALKVGCLVAAAGLVAVASQA